MAEEDRIIIYSNSGCEYIPNTSNAIIKHGWTAPVDRDAGGGGWPHKP